MANSRYRGYNARTITYWWNTLIVSNWDMWGITLKTIINEQNNLKMANSRYGGYNTQNSPLCIKHCENGKFPMICVFYKKLFYRSKTLIMANWDMGYITLKTIFYGQNTLNMANSRSGGYTKQNNPLWIKYSENDKFQIPG